ncbi:unnamed protein product [Urochloa humidicola]
MCAGHPRSRCSRPRLGNTVEGGAVVDDHVVEGDEVELRPCWPQRAADASALPLHPRSSDDEHHLSCRASFPRHTGSRALDRSLGPPPPPCRPESGSPAALSVLRRVRIRPSGALPRRGCGRGEPRRRWCPRAHPLPFSAAAMLRTAGRGARCSSSAGSHARHRQRCQHGRNSTHASPLPQDLHDGADPRAGARLEAARLRVLRLVVPVVGAARAAEGSGAGRVLEELFKRGAEARGDGLVAPGPQRPAAAAGPPTRCSGTGRAPARPPPRGDTPPPPRTHQTAPGEQKHQIRRPPTRVVPTP